MTARYATYTLTMCDCVPQGRDLVVYAAPIVQRATLKACVAGATPSATIAAHKLLHKLRKYPYPRVLGYLASKVRQGGVWFTHLPVTRDPHARRRSEARQCLRRPFMCSVAPTTPV